MSDLEWSVESGAWRELTPPFTPHSRLSTLHSLFEVVHQPHERVKANDPWCIGHEVRQCVDVVEVVATVAVVDEVLDAADVELHVPRDPLHLTDDLGRRGEALDAHAVLGGVDGARAAHELLARGRLADVGRAEVEGARGRVDVDRVQELAAEHLDASDVAG